ncbi:MAG: hypothetical protein WKF88_08935 [Ferruginibacter sp.]
MKEELRFLMSEYTDRELFGIMYRSATGDPEITTAAEEELRNRNMFTDEIAERRQVLIDEEEDILSEGTAATVPQQVFGWLGIFGILGLIIGHDLYFSKRKSVYTGKEYPEYDEASRESGRMIFFISVVTHSLFFLFKFVPWLENRFG